MVKLLTLTSSAAELEELVPLIRQLYFSGRVEIVSLVATPEEEELRANPSCHRNLREFAQPPLECQEAWSREKLQEAARNALMEERPELVLWSTESKLRGGLKLTLKAAGSGRISIGSPSKGLSEVLHELKSWRSIATCCPWKGDGTGVHGASLGVTGKLSSKSLLLKTTPELLRACQYRYPQIDFHSDSRLDSYPVGLSLLQLSYAEHPEKEILELRKSCAKTYSLEPSIPR